MSIGGGELSWVAPTIMGVGSLLTSVVSAVVALRAGSLAREAKTGAQDNKTEIDKTHQLVNSRMDEMLKLARAEATATATTVAQEAERLRTAEAQRSKDTGKTDDISRIERMVADLQAQISAPRRRAPPRD